MIDIKQILLMQNSREKKELNRFLINLSNLKYEKYSIRISH